MLSGRRRCSPPGPLPTGTLRSIELRSSARSSGRSSARSVVRTAAMPQPMSTPTAAGMIAPRVGTTEPTVAPMPRCTSGITATHGPDEGQGGDVAQLLPRLLLERHAAHPALDRRGRAGCMQEFVRVLRVHGSFLGKGSMRRFRPPQWSLLLQADQLLHDAIQAAEHGQLVDLLGDRCSIANGKNKTPPGDEPEGVRVPREVGVTDLPCQEISRCGQLRRECAVPARARADRGRRAAVRDAWRWR